jgi:hypothetical protein
MTLYDRDAFRDAVFARDGGKCVICGQPAADAHHIIERRLWPDGGYYLENGASLCAEHHLAAEGTRLSCEDIRAAAGITVVALPAHFDREERYDKWGNVCLPNGLRVRGELFFDESVQAILKSGGVLDQFTKYVKFPKISHLPWSDAIDQRTDRVLSEKEVLDSFQGREVVVTEKVDGENTSMYRDYIHARSLNSRNHPSRNWVKNLHARIAHEIPEDWRICGENLYAAHSIQYRGLPSFFLVFAIYNERNECLGWDEMVSYAGILELATVPVLHRGHYDENRIKACFPGQSVFAGSPQEGYVVRLADAIPWVNHRTSVAKFVRKGHVQTSHNWMSQPIVPNTLADGAKESRS